MAVPATTGILRTKVHEMEIGDYIIWSYGPNTGHILGDAKGLPELPYNSIASGKLAHYWYGIKVDKGLIISDRVAVHSWSWDGINSAKQIQGFTNTFGNLIPRMTSNTTPSGVASASGVYGPYAAYLAFNGTVTSATDCWAVQASSGTLQYKFDSPQIISGYSLRPQLGTPQGAPKDWEFKASNDGIKWTTLDTKSNQTNWSDIEPRYFKFSNSNEYLYYLIDIKQNNGHSHTTISELEMYNGYVIGVIRSLTGGVAYVDANGNMSLNDFGLGAWPTNNEWDKYIMNFPSQMIQDGKTLDDVFHINNIFTFVQDTTVIGTFKNIEGATQVSNSTWRIIRGFDNRTDSAWRGLSLIGSSGVSAIVGFRPIFEYQE